MPAEIRLHRLEGEDIKSSYVLVQIDPTTHEIISYSLSTDPVSLGRKVADIANESITGVAVETDITESFHVGRIKDLKNRDLEVFELSVEETEKFWLGYLSAPRVIKY